jgi:hypothetical protein
MKMNNGFSANGKLSKTIIKLAQALPCALKARVTLAQGEALGHRPLATSAG